METLSWIGNIASIVGFALSVYAIIETARTRRWAERKIERSARRLNRFRIAGQLDVARRAAARVVEAPASHSVGSWRAELRTTLAEVQNDAFLPFEDQRMIQRHVRGLQVPSRDAGREAARLRGLLDDLSDVRSRLLSALAEGDGE